MTQLTARQIVLAARPQGRPRPADFRLERIAVPEPGANQLLLEARFLSLDPYMRGRMSDARSYAKPVEIGQAMPGETVCRVIASNLAGFAAGDSVRAQTGWRSHAISSGAGVVRLDPDAAPLAANLGVLGMPGFTAYAGLLAIGKPRRGETVVVAAASGPVGALVGQLAQSRGARTVGIAGGAEKCAYVRETLGFDAALDHRAPDLAARLAAACPSGIDVYFENVGGAIWQAVLPLLNSYARIPVCGLIAQYNGGDSGLPDHLPATMRAILTRSLTVRGFINTEFVEALYPDFQREVGAGLREGRIRYREDIVDGLENAPDAFIGLLEGRNFGKLLIRI